MEFLNIPLGDLNVFLFLPTQKVMKRSRTSDEKASC